MSLILKPIEIPNPNELLSLAAGPFKEAPFHFQILDRNVGTRKSGTADFVAVDADKRLNLVYLLAEKPESRFFSAVSNYFWACENILNLKKMYPQGEWTASAEPRLVFLSPHFSSSLKKVLTLLKAETLALEYRVFEANAVPCLLLERVLLREDETALREIELEKLKKEYSTGARFLSEEEILEFLNFEKQQSLER